MSFPRMRGPKSLGALFAAVALLVLSSAAHAQGAFADPHDFDVPAQPVASALVQFSRQAEVQVVTDGLELDGIQANAVKGRLSARDAIGKLLTNTGLGFEITGPRTVVVTRQGQRRGANAAVEEAAKGEKIEVTGTRLKAANDSVPVKTYNAEQIERSGKTTVADFLNTLPEVSVLADQTRFNTNGGQVTVRLHGFPAGTTATLLNGRALAPSADLGTAFDLNVLPLAFLERIDVLPSGSSAVYGSDAIAGVVNFITKREINGVHAQASYGHAANYPEQNYAVGAGGTWGRASISLVASYDKHDTLFAADRDITNNADYSRFASQGGVDRRVSTCNPGNISSTTTANLPGLTSRIATIPLGITSRPSTSAFVAGQGQTNLCAATAILGLIPGVERTGGLATGRYEISGSIEAFAELLYSNVKTDGRSPAQSIFSRVVPATNAFNPFGVAVQVTSQLPVFSGTFNNRDFFRPLVGIRGEAFSTWDWEFAVRRSQDRNQLDNFNTNGPGIVAALASSDPAAALNPFATSPEGLSAASVAASFLNAVSHYRMDVNTADLRVRGDVLRLPAGAVKLVAGVEASHQTYVTVTQAVSGTTGLATVTTAAGRNISAAFAEARIPVLRGGGEGGELLAATAAGRYDRYSDFGSKATPQFGVELRPASGLLVRGSYAEAFRAPQLIQLYQGPTTFGTTVVDTGRPGSPTQAGVPFTNGGNPNLDPETGKAYGLGVVWAGKAVPGLLVSCDFWWLVESKRIVTPALAALIAFPDVFPGRVVRDPATGAIVSINDAVTNFGDLRARGADIALSYAFDSPIGKLTPSVNWVTTTKFTAALQPGADLVDRLGQATSIDAWSPRNKATFALAWTRGPYSATVGGRYLGKYKDYITTPANTNVLGDYVLWDASTRVSLDELVGKTYFKSATLTASVVNALDKAPQFANFRTVGYDPSQADILGRFVRVGVSIDW